MSTVDLQSTTDAKVWTDEFWRLHGDQRLSLDWGTMRTWFANAIEVGRAAGQAGPLPQVTTVEELEALPLRTKLLANNGDALEVWESTHGVHAGWRSYRFIGNRVEYSSELVAERYGPFAVIWRSS